MSAEAREIVGDPRAGSLLFTCEHAGRALPEWQASAEDRRYLDDHWGWDVGAGALTRVLAERMGCAAVLSCFSRLVCDPNREPDEPSFVVREVDGHTLSFNRAVDDRERTRRRERYFDPYHDAIDELLAARRDAGDRVGLCSIHSFTAVHVGEARDMEVGVLFDDHEPLARRLAGALGDEGFVTALNEPYSGFAGLVYAVSRHGRAHRVPYVELEVRNDLLRDVASVASMAERIARALAGFARVAAGAG